ncbi:MAG: polymer-forming cytoskeletal protein [Treponema sp.]|nr:polymer-forming cytoskeletal protein [Treponema sp.]
MPVRSDDTSINTIIGEGSAVKGDVQVNGFVCIYGDIAGDVATDGAILIGEKARVRGNISAASVTVNGIVLGNISAHEHIELLGSSAVIGDIIARHVRIEDKVIFHGRCISIADDKRYTAEAERFLQEKALRQKMEHVSDERR